MEAFVDRLAPAPTEADQLVAAGDEASLRQALELEPDHPGAVAGPGPPAHRPRAAGRGARVARPESPRRPRPARSRPRPAWPGQQVDVPADGVDALLDALLDRVKDDEAARQEFLDLLETLGPDDPRTARYRKALAARLF